MESFDEIENDKEFSSFAFGSLGDVRYKLLVMIFLIFMFLTSTVFMNKVLSNFTGTVEHGEMTVKGQVIGGMFAVLLYVAADSLDKNELI